MVAHNAHSPISFRRTSAPSEEIEDSIESSYTQDSSIQSKMTKAWKKETKKETKEIMHRPYSLRNDTSIELQTADEESDLVNEYDFPTQSDFKQVTIEDFSSRALCSVISVMICTTLCLVGNYFLVHYEYMDWTTEYRTVIWIITAYQGLTILALVYEALGEILCCYCLDKVYVRQNEGVSILIAAYLPNEKEIIKDTLLHVINNVECDRNVNVTLIYNTPDSVCPEETEMLRFHKKIMNDRKVYVIKNTTSTSKAQNLNFGLAYLKQKKDLQEYTYIIDADHYPDRDCLQRLIRTLESNPKTDCVHGTTYIRNRGNSGYGCIARLVDAEFFYFYNLLFPALHHISGNAFFGGSNGIWRTSSLTRFDNEMLTEDIDLSLRSIIDHRQIVPEYRARSGELIPKGPTALWNQRLRWAIGWNEVTYKYFNAYFFVGFRNFSIRELLGILFLLLFRYYAFVFFALSFVFSWLGNYGIMTEDDDLLWFTNLSFAAYSVVGMLLVAIRFPLSIKNLDLSNWEILDQLICLLIFFFLGPVYLLWNTLLEIIANVRIIFRKEAKWTVTARSLSLGS